LYIFSPVAASAPWVRPSSLPTLSMTSAWKLPSAMCASACLGASLMVVSSACLTLAPRPLRQRLGHADALAVAAQRVGLPVPGVGVLRFGGLLRLGAFGGLQEHRQLGLLALLQVVGVDALRLVGHRDAGTAGLQAGVKGLLEVAGVEQRPGGQHLVVLRQGSASPWCSRAQCFFSAAAS
jgi:hypothetical protein